MSKVKLTAQQSIAATARGNALLVSAAAGSGKTMVLVQRLMNMICDDEINADITDFLVITYTRAAAAELRSRVLQEINRRIAENPYDKRLRRQAALCVKANISTIHSFCTQILRENAHLIDLSPDFRVAEESETDLIKNEVLERVIEERYENIYNDAEFKAFADLLVETRGDKKLFSTVLDAYEKLRSHPMPERWMDEQEKQMCLEGITDLSETIWGKEIIEHTKATVSFCAEKMSAALDEMHDFPDMLRAYGNSFAVTVNCLKALSAALEKGWDSALEYCNIQFPTARISGYEYFKGIRSKCKDILEKELAVFEGTSAELLEDIRQISLEVKGLYSVLKDFSAAYQAEKNRRGIIDFSDQEHLALKLLYDFDNNCPTALAKQVSSRFREILVDEYQDVNAVQEFIFTSVSKEEKNMFMVGDVKQSIYRFRMADPTIFLNKYLSFDEYSEENDAPQKVLLPQNFRSRAEILNAVNYIFANLMSEQFGEMNYTEKEYLNPGAAYEATEEPCVEYDILEVPKEHSDDTVSAEAEFTAKRIKEIIEGGMQVTDGGVLRNAEYKDFAILLRSIKGRAWKYAVALDKFGIPAEIPVADDFFESYEISVMVSLLAVIDNPHQDIPLIAVLRSPFFGFTLDELTAIRTKNRKCDLFDAVKECSEINEKCGKFISELEYLRNTAANMPSDKFVWHIYSRTGFMELVSASAGSEDRKDNLLILAELARRFESNGFKGLFKFCGQLRVMMEKGSQTVSAEGSGGTGVRIMSIHKSKGLEFPIVILADTTHGFNLQDTTKPVLFHTDLGVGLYRRNNEKNYKYPTVARRAVSRRIVLETMSEELRVLYVALTRAKEKLIMISTVKDADKAFQKYWPNGEYPAAPTSLESIKSYSGWLMTTMLTRPESSKVYTPEEVRYSCSDDAVWDIRRIQYEPTEAVSNEEKSAAKIIPDDETMAKIRENLAFEYSYSDSTELPSKLTATELKGRVLDTEVSDGAHQRTKKLSKLNKPDFTRRDKPLTGSEKGTALHYVMQYIDYGKCTSPDSVADELERLVDKRFITRLQADAVKPESIVTFFDSDLGKALLSSRSVHREFKFSLLVKACDILPVESTDAVLFQGVIDCYFEDEDGITVIDFKTDKITDYNYDEKISTYSTQITSYSKALERITGKTVKNAILYFFELNKSVEII